MHLYSLCTHVYVMRKQLYSYVCGLLLLFFSEPLNANKIHFPSQIYYFLTMSIFLSLCRIIFSLF